MEDKDNLLVYRLGHSDLYCAVTVSLNLSEIKPLHAKCMYEILKLDDWFWMILDDFGFESAVEKSNEVFARIQNPFLASRNYKN